MKGKEKQNYGKVPPWIVRFNRMVRAWMWEGSAGSFKVFFFYKQGSIRGDWILEEAFHSSTRSF